MFFCHAGIAHAQDKSPAIWSPTGNLIAQAGKENSEIGVELFAPVAQNDSSLLFLSARGAYTKRFHEDFSLTVGGRAMVADDLALGFNIGADLNQSEFSTHEQQSLSFGLEAFTSFLDARVNYRLPLSDNRTFALQDPVNGPMKLLIEDNRLIERHFGYRLDEVPLAGANGEVGVRLPISDRVNFRLSGGGFHYSDDDAPQKYHGVRGGIEFNVEDPGRRDAFRFSIGAQIQDDNRFGTHASAMGRITIPLGRRGDSSRPVSRLQQQMGDRVRRDYAGPSGVQKTDLTSSVFAKDARTGNEFGGFYFVNGAGTANGSGSAANPTTLSNAVAKAGQNGVVVVLGNSGTVTTSGVTLAEDQYLLGGASSVNVKLSTGGITQFGFGGTNGTIAGTNAAGAAVTLGQNSVVRDLTITGAGVGIASDGMDGLIEKVTVSGSGGPGITIAGGGTVTLRTSTVSGSAGAVDIDDDGGALTVALSDLNLSASDGNVLDIDGSGTGTVTVTGLSGITIEGGNGEDGGFAATDVAFNNVSGGHMQVGTATDRVSGNGVALDNVTGALTFSDLDVANSGGTGVLVDNSKANFTLTTLDGTVDTVGGTALDLDPLKINLKFASVSSTDAAGQGVLLDDVQGVGAGGVGLQIGKLTVTDSGAQGLLITGGSTGTVIITDGSITGSGGAAVQVGEDGVAGSGGTVNLSFGADVDQDGTSPALALYEIGGSLAFTGAITGSGGIEIIDTLAGSAITIAGPSLKGTTGPAIFLDNTVGVVTFTGTTNIANPLGDGIVIGDVPGGVMFGDVNITGLGAATGLDVTGAHGSVMFDTLDITGTGAAGSVGIDVTGSTNAGNVIIAQPSTITGVHIGVDLTNASMSGTFRYGDGNPTPLNSAISADIPLVIAGMNETHGSYNFADVHLVGDVSNLTGGDVTVFWVQDGATGSGTTALDPGSLADAEGSGKDYIVLLDAAGSGGQDVIDTSGLSDGRLDLADGQHLVSFLYGDTISVSGSNLPANLIVSGLPDPSITNPNANSGAPILRGVTIGSATVDLANNSVIDGVVIENTGASIGVTGFGVSNASVLNSDISGAMGAISIFDNGAATSVLLSNVNLAAGDGNVLTSDGQGAGTVTLSGSGIDITATGDAIGVSLQDVTSAGLAFGTVTTGVSQAAAIDINTLNGGSVSFDSVTIGGTASGAGISLVNVTGTVNFDTTSVSNTNGAGIALSNIDGKVEFGATTINNPGTAGIIFGAGSAGDVTFGDVDITGLGANATGVDATAMNGGSGADVTFNTLDITGASTSGTTGIDLTGATFGGNFATLNTSNITGVGIGVDLTNANISGNFQFGDGESVNDVASKINVGAGNIPIVIAGLNAAQGTYNFKDVELTGNTNNLETTASVYYVIAGGTGDGSRLNPGSLSDAENQNVQYIVLLNNPSGGQDVIDAASAGGTFELDAGQELFAFGGGDNTLNVPGALPINVYVNGVVQGITNPYANSGAPVLTTTGSSVPTVNLATNTILDGLIIANDGGGVGVYGSGAVNVIIRNSTISGDGGAIEIHDGSAAAYIALNNLILSADGGTVLNLLGTDSGSLTVKDFYNLTINHDGESNGIVVNDVTFDSDLVAGGIQTVDAGSAAIGTTGSRVTGLGLSLNNVSGSLSFPDLDIANTGNTGLKVANSKANSFTLTTLDGTIDTTSGTAVDLDPLTLNMTLSSVTASGGGYGVILDQVGGTFTITGTLSATDVLNAALRINDSAATVDIGTLNVSVPAQFGSGIQVTQAIAGTLDLTIGDGAISTSNGLPVSITNTGSGTINLDIALSDVSTSAPVGRGIRIDNTGAGNIAGSFSAADGDITAQVDGIYLVGGNYNFTYGGDVTTSGAIAHSVNITNRPGGSVTLSGAITDTGDGIVLSNISGGSVTIAGPTITNVAGAGISLTNIDGAVTFTGTTAISNPGTAGIMLGAGSDGIITFGDVDITNLGPNTTGVDATAMNGTSLTGSVTFNTLDIDGATNSGTTGIDLTGATYYGTIKTTDTSTITDVGIGVDLTNAGISGLFQFGDGEDVTDTESKITLALTDKPIVITGLDSSKGTYNFKDVDLTGDTSNLATSATVYYVSATGTGNGSRLNPGSLADAQASGFDYIVLLDTAGSGGQDTIDGSALSSGSFDLVAGQTLLSFRDQDAFVLPGGAPVNVYLNGVITGVVNPNTGSGAPLLTSNGTATVNVATNAVIDGVEIANSGSGVGIYGSDAVNVAIWNSTVSGRSAIEFHDGGIASSIALFDLDLSGDGGPALLLSGTNIVGTLTITQFSDITVVSGNSGGISIEDAIFDADLATGGYQTVNAGNLQVGTTTSRISGNGFYLTNVNGALSFADFDVANSTGYGVRVANSGANSFSFNTADGAIDTLNGTALSLTSAALSGSLSSVTSDNGGFGVQLSKTSGSFNIGTVSTTGVGNQALYVEDAIGTVTVGTLTAASPSATSGGIYVSNGASVSGTLNLNISGGTILSDAINSPVIISNAGSGTINLNVTLANISNNGVVGRGIRIDNTGAGNIAGSFDVTDGSITAVLDGIYLIGGDYNFTYGGDVTTSGAIAHSVNIDNRTGGSVTLSGAITDTGDGILISDLSSGSITIAGPTISNVAGVGITLANIDGTVTFTGTTTISNPGTTGIVLGAGSDGDITFGDVDITGLGANTTGVDATAMNGGVNGDVLFNTLDITGVSTVGTTGIDLTGATFKGTIKTTESSDITGVHIGVDLTNASIGASATFQYGDGSNIDPDGADSTINLGLTDIPIVVAGMNGSQGTYNFEDVVLTGDTSNLSLSVYYVKAGASGSGALADPGSLAGAAGWVGTYIVLLNDPAGGQDTLDAASVGGSFQLDPGQTLLSFEEQDSFTNIPGGAPANVHLYGITGGGSITNPYANSGAPILTTSLSGYDTLVLGGTNVIDGVLIHNELTAGGYGISGANIVDVVIQNSTVQGRIGAINLADGASNGRLALSNLTLSSFGGDVLTVDGGVGSGTLSVTDFSDITILGGNLEVGGAAVADVVFDADPDTAGLQTVSGGTFTAGTTSNRVGGYGLLLYQLSGALDFDATNIAVLRASNVPVFGGNVSTGIYATLNINTASTVDFGVGNIDVNSIASSGGFHSGVHLEVNNGNSMGFSGNLSINATGGAGGLTAASFGGGAGTLFLGGTNNDIISGANGMGLSNLTLNNGALSPSAAQFDTITVSGGTGYGISMANISSPGTTMFNGPVTISNIGGTALSFSNPDDVTFNGAITTTNAAGGVTGALSGATLTFGGGLSMSGTATNGLSMSGGTFILPGTNTIAITGGPALSLSQLTVGNGSGGAASFQTVSASGYSGSVAGLRINATNGLIDFGTVTLAPANVAGASYGIMIDGNNSGTFTFAGPTSITAGTGDTGLYIIKDGTSALNLSFTGDLDITATTGDAVHITDNSTANNFNLQIQNAGSSFTNTGSGYGLWIDGSGNGTISNAASITESGGGYAAIVVGRTGGSVTQSGNISSTSPIRIGGSSGGTVTFTSGAITLNTGTLDGIQFLSSSNPFTASFTGGNLDIDTTTGVGVNLSGGGNFTISGSGNSITTNSPGPGGGIGVSIAGGNGNIDINAPITINGVGQAVAISSRTGGTVDIRGNILSNSGSGIAINSNTGGTVNFHGSATLNTGTQDALTLSANSGGTVNFLNGGLVINTTTGRGLYIIGGSSLNIAGAGNTINTTSGTVVEITNSSANALALNALFASASNTSGANGFLISNTGAGGTTGTLNVQSGAITATTYGAHLVGGALNFTYGGNITTSGASALSVEVFGRTGGTATFAGNINDTSLGISIGSNTGGSIIFSGAQVLNVTSSVALMVASNSAATTISFNGGLDIDTTSGIGIQFASDNSNFTISGTGNSITTATGVGAWVSGGAGTININAAIATTGAGYLARTDNRTGGTITFSGNLNTTNATGSSLGILLQSASGGTVNFSGGTKTLNTGANTAVTVLSNTGGAINFTNGGLDIDTSSGTGLTLAGGGDFTISGTGNTITTATGTGVVLGASNTGTININADITTTGTDGMLVFALNRLGGTATLSGNLLNANTTGVGRGIRVQDSTGGSIIFSGASKVLTTGTRNAIEMAGNSAGSSLSFTNGGLDIDTTTGKGILVTGGGDLTVSGAGNTITTVSGTAVDIGAGTGTIDINAVISSGSGLLASIQSRTGGTTTLSGNLGTSGSGLGILVQNNTGGTINFSGGTKTLNTGTNTAVRLLANTGATINFTGGGLDIDTTTGTGFLATGGGTITVQGTNNSINSTSQTALNVANTTIGASGLTFQSISSGNNTAAADPVNGIILNATGSSGGLTVTGDAGGSNNGSGGTIQNTSGAGVLLTNTANVSLGYMNITGSADDGISGSTVNGFTLNRSNVSNSGNAVGEAGVDLAQLSGTSNVTNSNITNSYENNFRVLNSSGSATLNVNQSSFSNTSSNLASDDGMLLEASGTATITATVENSTFSANRGDHFQAAALNSGNLNIIFRNNTLSGGHSTALGQGITINAATGAPGYSGTVNYKIENNVINGAISNAINVNLGTSSAAALFNGFITGNQIGTVGQAKSGSTQANGINVEAHGNGTHTVQVSSNTVVEAFDRAMNVLANDGNGVLNLTVQSNNLSVSSDPLGSREAFFLNAGSTSTNVFGQVDSHTVRLNLGGAGALANTFAHGVGAPDDFRIRQRFNTRIEMPGYAGTAFDPTAVVSYIQGRNTGSAGEPGSATVNDSPTVTTDGFFSGSVPLPTNF